MKSSRVPQLDLLRIVAVVLVLGRHMGYDGDNRFALAWKTAGWIGVDMFFVLSGFLISGLLFKEYAAHGKINFRRFYVRRAFKLYPAFYCLIAVTVAARLLSSGIVETRPLLAEVLFLQDYVPGLWNHTWSLGVEEHFYLFLPLALAYIYRSGRLDHLPRVFLAVAVALLVLRLATALTLGLRYTGTPTHLRLDSLLFGVLVSYYYHYAPHKLRAVTDRPRLALALSLAGVSFSLILPFESSLFVHTLGFTLLYLSFGALLVLTLSAGWVARACLTAPGRLLARLGEHSYSIYLWHMAVQIWGLRVLHHLFPHLHPLASASVYMAGSLAVGVLAAKVIELPVLRLRDAAFPPLAKKAPVAGLTPALDQLAGGTNLR